MIVLKIILFILLAVLAIILLLLLMPLKVQFSFIGEKLKYKLSYAFLNFYDSEGGGFILKLINKRKKSGSDDAKTDPQDSTSEPQDKSDVKSESSEEEAVDQPESSNDSEVRTDSPVKDDAAEDKKSEKSEEKDSGAKKTLGDRVDFLMKLWSCAKHPARRIFKGFHLSNVYIDFLIANEDAYKCAMRYGQVCALTYNLLAQFSGLFTVKYKTIDIECGFAAEKSRWDGGFSLWFLPITAVISGAWFLITYIFRVYLPGKSADRKTKKSADTDL